jgi:hypothetical protein
LRNKDLHNLQAYSSQNSIKQCSQARLHGGRISAHGTVVVSKRILVEEPQMERPLERPKRIRKNGIKTELSKTECGRQLGSAWCRTGTASDRLEHSNKPSGFVNGWKILNHWTSEGLCSVF